MKRFSLLVCAALAVLLSVPRARAFETDALTRDPSTIIKRNNTYWVYGTGVGIEQFSSTDRVHWKKHGPVLPKAPAWVAEKAPTNTGNVAWAPDVHLINGKYYLYYCYSEFGTNHSGLGVATSTTLDPNSWRDQGLVVFSGVGTNFNCIDPCFFQDAEGKTWLSFGSYFSGIKLISIDPNTGKRAPASPIYDLATRPTTPGNAIEASAVYFHDGYYYLFVNFDSCCAGAKSAYNIRMGRSQNVTGPYTDRDGKRMMEGGGTVFLNAVYDNGSGRLIDDQTGPGHVGIIREPDGFYVSTHYEWARDHNGATTTNINRLAWDADGWPRALLDEGPYKLVSNLATHDVATVVDKPAPGETALQMQPDTGAQSQRWKVTYQGDGFYSLPRATDGLALSVIGDVGERGAKIELAPFTKRAGQLWNLARNEDGTFTLQTKPSGGKVVLDVANCSPNDGTPVGTWDSNAMDCQKWSLRMR